MDTYYALLDRSDELLSDLFDYDCLGAQLYHALRISIDFARESPDQAWHSVTELSTAHNGDVGLPFDKTLQTHSIAELITQLALDGWLIVKWYEHGLARVVEQTGEHDKRIVPYVE